MNLKTFSKDLKNKKRLIPQVLTLLTIVLAISYFAFNAQVNMDNRGIAFGFGFLTQEASFDIGFSLIDYDGSHSYARAFLVGLLNTLLVSVIGIFFATLIGVTVGIGRLSSNYLVAKFSEVYVEVFRNIPLLLQLFFWYFAALRALPLPEQAINFYDISYLTVKGWYVPKFIWANFSIFIYSVIAAIVAIIFVSKYAKKQREELGRHISSFYIGLVLLFIFPTLSFLIGGVTLEFEIPVLKQMSATIFNFHGGVSIIPELMALAMALSMYTATFIAENVRAGILGIGKGQKEAAASIGLTKNSSLAAAIAYPDIVLVFAGTALMQTGRAIEIVSITMGTYLLISLSISSFMNWYNQSVAIKEK